MLAVALRSNQHPKSEDLGHRSTWLVRKGKKHIIWKQDRKAGLSGNRINRGWAVEESDVENFLWTCVGAVLSLAVYLGYELLHQLRTPTKVFGCWHSAWQPTVSGGWSWVGDTVEVRRSFCKIRLRNRDNSAGYRWKAVARLIDNTYLLGEWRSTNPGANAEGVFALTFSVEGRYMIGYIMTRDVGARKIVSGWVLARSEEDLAEGKRRLEATRVMFPKEQQLSG